MSWIPRPRERRRVKLDERLPTKLINLILDAATMWLSWLFGSLVNGPREMTKAEPMLIDEKDLLGIRDVVVMLA